MNLVTTPMSPSHPTTRRHFMHHASRVTAVAAAAAAMPMVSTPARAALRGEQRLSLVHTHTRERLALTFAADGRFDPAALAALDHFLRDHYSGEVGRIDALLFDLMHRIQRELGHEGAFEIISGYRAPATNARLRESRGGGVARHSLHMEGRALDLRLPGVPLSDLRDAARAQRGGGVGFYAREQFVHLDTGRVRGW
jgi:uncharacterized protein YcbK (DUF882 family)